MCFCIPSFFCLNRFSTADVSISQGLGKTVSVIALIQMQKFLLTQKSVDLDDDNDKGF